MLGTLLAKDLRRARRNPIAFLIHLAAPVLITALIGLTFRGCGQGGGLGRIRLALVDEDDSLLSQLLRSAVGQQEASRHVQVEFLARDEALRQISDNRLSAVVILPRGFTAGYLSGTGTVTWELVKNPAQSFHPAVVEELLAALTTGLNALGRNFRPELVAWRDLVQGPTRPAPKEVGALVERTAARWDSARAQLFPPRISYTKRQQADVATAGQGPGWNPFAYLLPGLAAMFLIFIADNANRDLYREQRFRTLDRFRTLRADLLVFVAAKGLYALVILLIASLILFGGGALVFGIQWTRPGALALLVLSYAVFAAGFTACLGALAGSEKRADTLNAIMGMALGLAGGCMFPREQLPALFREHLTPLMPTHWFAAAARGLQGSPGAPDWAAAAGGLVLVGAVLLVIASRIFQRRLERGGAT